MHSLMGRFSGKTTPDRKFCMAKSQTNSTDGNAFALQLRRTPIIAMYRIPCRYIAYLQLSEMASKLH